MGIYSSVCPAPNKCVRRSWSACKVDRQLRMCLTVSATLLLQTDGAFVLEPKSLSHLHHSSIVVGL